MKADEQSRIVEDVIYLVDQMIHAERRVDLISYLVFYYDRWSPPNAVRLTPEEERFFGNAILEAFLLSYRNLLDFFHRPKRKGNNRYQDSLAEADFDFQRMLTKDADGEFERVSKHLAHLSEVRRARTSNQTWHLTSTLIACRPTLKEFFDHCLSNYPHCCSVLQPQIRQLVHHLDFLGTEDHFIYHKHASRSPFMSHDAPSRISIPEPSKAEPAAGGNAE